MQERDKAKQVLQRRASDLQFEENKVKLLRAHLQGMRDFTEQHAASTSTQHWQDAADDLLYAVGSRWNTLVDMIALCSQLNDD